MTCAITILCWLINTVPALYILVWLSPVSAQPDYCELDEVMRQCLCHFMCRVGKGIWRRGAETPNPVKWEERIIELREGNWTYIGGSSMGYAPGKC